MTAVGYRALRLLRTQWRAASGLAIVVALAGGLVLTLVAGAHRTATAADRYEDALGQQWDATIEQAQGRARVDDLEALPAVDDVEAATFFFGGLSPGGPEELVDAIPFAGDPEALLAEVVEGRAADPDQPTEFVANRSWVAAADAQVGDHFRLFTIRSETAAANGFDAPEPDGPSFDTTLVGVIAGPAELQDELPLALFPPGLLDEGDIGTSASEILVGLAGGADLGQLRDELDALPDGSDFSIGPVEVVPPDLRDAVATQATALAVIAAITGVAGLVLAGQVALRAIRLSEDQRLSLRALGLTRRQLVLDGGLRVAVPAVVGVVLAGVLAVAASDLFPRGFARRLEPDPGPMLDPLVHVLGPPLLALGLVATVAAIVLLGRRARTPRLSPVDRLTAQLGEAKAAMGLRFAFARHARDAGSLSTPLVGLAVLVTMLVAAVTFGQSFVELVDEPTRWGTTFELASGQGGSARVPDEAQQAVVADPDVSGLTLLGSTTVARGEDAVGLSGFEPVEGRFVVTTLDGDPPARDDEIALGAVAARNLDVDLGDELTLQGSADPVTYRVTALAVVPGVEGVEGLGQSGLVTADGLARVDPEAAMADMAIDLRPGADVDEVRDRLSAATGLTIGQFDPPGVIADYRRVRGAAWLVAGLLGILVVITVVNLVAVTLNRRGRDIAVLRSLGADRRWVSRVEHWHALAVGLAVGLVGAALGVGLGRTLFRWRVTERIGATDEAALPILAVGLGVVALVVLADVVAQVAIRWRRGGVARRLATE